MAAPLWQRTCDDGRVSRLAAAIALALTACRSSGAGGASEPAVTQPPSADPSGVDIPQVDGPLCDGVDLDVVAACLRHAMTVVPQPQEPFDTLLQDAATTGQLDARCVALAGPDGLRTDSGAALAVTAESSDWDHLDDGTAQRYVDVRIGCACCPEVASFSVTVTVGGGTS
jgi:hypothetical protein